MAPIPVTIVTGFLGSGKTTLLKHILGGDHGKKIAVIQNELAAERGIEAPGAKGVTGPNGEVFADWVELANGCVCCSVRDDLVSALEVLVKREGFDNILIETTGLADPGPLASIFWLDEALDSALQLDAIVTVVDSKYCKQHLDEEKPAGEVNECARQIAFADRIVMNKQDMVAEADRITLLQRVRGINPQAPLSTCSYSKVPLEAIIGVSAFDLDHAAQLLAEHEREEREAQAAAAASAAPSTGGLVPGVSLTASYGQGQRLRHSQDGHSSTDCKECQEEEQQRRLLGAKHGDKVGTVTLTVPGEIDLQQFKMWLGTFLWEEQAKLGMETYRYKGLISVRGEDEQYVLQGVHDTFELEPGPTKKPASQAASKFVFIGKCLDGALLDGQLKALASAPSTATA